MLINIFFKKDLKKKKQLSHTNSSVTFPQVLKLWQNKHLNHQFPPSNLLIRQSNSAAISDSLSVQSTAEVFELPNELCGTKK